MKRFVIAIISVLTLAFVDVARADQVRFFSVLEDGIEYSQDIHYTVLTLDGEHCGVGGIDSWGARPLEQYRLPSIDRTCSFTITPVVNHLIQ